MAKIIVLLFSLLFPHANCNLDYSFLDTPDITFSNGKQYYGNTKESAKFGHIIPHGKGSLLEADGSATIYHGQWYEGM